MSDVDWWGEPAFDYWSGNSEEYNAFDDEED